jgi:kynureninase
MVQGLTDLVGLEYCQLKLVDEEQIVASLDDSIALLLLTQVNFRRSKLFDMQKNHRSGP